MPTTRRQLEENLFASWIVSSLDVLFVVAGIDTRHPYFLE
jgi:hypothetical protein